MKRAGVLTNVLRLFCNTLCMFVLLLKTGGMECITTKLSYYITWWAGGVVRGGGALGPHSSLTGPHLLLTIFMSMVQNAS